MKRREEKEEAEGKLLLDTSQKLCVAAHLSNILVTILATPSARCRLDQQKMKLSVYAHSETDAVMLVRVGDIDTDVAKDGFAIM